MDLRQILQNTAFLTVSYTISKVLVSVWQLFLIRYYADQPNLYGDYVNLISLCAIWLIVADGAVLTAHQQIITQNKLSFQTQIQVLLLIRLISGGMAASGFYISVILQNYSNWLPALFFAFQIGLIAVGSVPLILFAIDGKFSIESLSSLIGSLLFIIPAFIILKYTNEIIYLAVSGAIGAAASALYIWIKWFSYYSSAVSWRPMSFRYIGEYLKLMIPATMIAFAFVLFYRIDITVIYNNMGKKQAGIYSISILLFFLMLDVIWGQFGKVFSSAVYHKWATISRRRYYSIILHDIFICFNFVVILGLLAQVFFLENILEILFGKNSVWVESHASVFILTMGLQCAIGLSIALRIAAAENVLNKSACIIFLIALIKYIFLANVYYGNSLAGVAVANVLFSIMTYIGIAFMLDKHARNLFLRSSSIFTVAAPILMVLLYRVNFTSSSLDKYYYEILLLFIILLIWFYGKKKIVRTVRSIRSTL
jgi:O-antigen/teichoic acid export membrane protein